MSWKTSYAAFMLAFVNLPSLARAEVIGNYIVEAPVSAVLTAGGGPPATWLNVVNNPVSINDAFTGHSILDDGFGNVPAATTIVLTFAPGVLRNRPGPDLIFYDADPKSNVYLVSTSHDNFAGQGAVGFFADTGLDRTYFLGGAGPTNRDVRAGGWDLTQVGVPLGTSVDQVEVFTEYPSSDPLGFGAVQGTIPTVSGWGLLVLTLLVLAAATVVIPRARSRGLS